ncbi:MAG: HypC/HybG/HupF family hydrogenase formation chaperone [Ignavibacteria bacterium]|nr:HypC/HybG/HupF family hydrogenase formation chaperone [Ignavibacteria bacterium]
MCLAIPGKIVTINENSSPKIAKVSFGGALRDICIDWVPDVKPGEYVLVHVGFALNVIDEEEARETLKLLNEIEENYDKNTPE